MKINLTERDYECIFDIAHREWLDDTGRSWEKRNPDKYLLARCYFNAITLYLERKGYKIEKK